MSEKILNVVIKLRRETEEFYDKVKFYERAVRI